MFVGEPDPLQRGAEELRESLPGLLTSQACSCALILGLGVSKREGSEEPPSCPMKALGPTLQGNGCQSQKLVGFSGGR